MVRFDKRFPDLHGQLLGHMGCCGEAVSCAQVGDIFADLRVIQGHAQDLHAADDILQILAECGVIVKYRMIREHGDGACAGHGITQVGIEVRGA